MAAFAASVFVLLCDDTDLLLLTPPLHFHAHVLLIGYAYLHKLIHLTGLVCGYWVSSIRLGCEDKETR